MTIDAKSKLLRLVIAAISVFLVAINGDAWDSGDALFIVPVMFVAIYIWLGVAFFFFELIWIALTKPDERLFAMNMLSGAAMVTAALAAGYWLIHDSIGLTATILYAFVAYFVLSIVRWFRRHTASYYAALEAEQQQVTPPTAEDDKLN